MDGRSFFPINDYPLGLLKQLDRVEAAGATLHELNQSSKKNSRISRAGKHSVKIKFIKIY